MAQSTLIQYFTSPAAQALNLEARQRAESGWVNSLAVRLTMLETASPKNRILFKAGYADCGLGEVCRLQVDTPFNLEFRMVLDNEFAEGDYITVNSKPKVGGAAGSTIGRYIKLPTMKLPVCGAKGSA